ncbi:MAG: Na+/H+ antiporter NhaC family protein [Halioglobus sp.]
MGSATSYALSKPTKICLRALTICLVLFCATTHAEFQIEAPKVVHVDTEFTVKIIQSDNHSKSSPDNLQLTIAGEAHSVQLTGGTTEVTRLRISQGGATTIVLHSEGKSITSTDVRIIPGWQSLIPPLIAIGLALWIKSVIPAIFFGLWAGLVLIYGFTFENVLDALLDVFAVNIVDELEDRGHISLLLFTAMIGGMVGVVSKNGGMGGVIKIVVKWANSAKRGQLSVYFLGLCIFFDDYTNTLVVGNSVRPITDRLKISREKLAYIVDSTAAPVACVAVFTTWIGYEVGLIGDAIEGIQGLNESSYTIFLKSIPYSFYPLAAIFFVYLIASSGRDFGPMLSAEKAARSAPDTTEQNPAEQTVEENSNPMPARAINAIAPILTLIISSAAGFYYTGEGDNLQDILSSADVYQALMWGSFLSAAVAGGLTLVQRLMPLEKIVQAWLDGANLMVPPLVILVLAWALSGITTTLGTADFLVALAGDLLIPALIPAIVFLLSAAAAFATGSSWGVMAIILPLVIPVAWTGLSMDGSVTGDEMHILYSTVSAVLAGSVWGDHCSPISDTTVLSSLASGCDHIEHVRTQIPYAFSVGAAALVCGIIPVGFGMSWWLGLLLTCAVLVVILRVFGRYSEPHI